MLLSSLKSHVKSPTVPTASFIYHHVCQVVKEMDPTQHSIYIFGILSFINTSFTLFIKDRIKTGEELKRELYFYFRKVLGIYWKLYQVLPQHKDIFKNIQRHVEYLPYLEDPTLDRSLEMAPFLNRMEELGITKDILCFNEYNAKSLKFAIDSSFQNIISKHAYRPFTEQSILFIFQIIGGVGAELIREYDSNIDFVALRRFVSGWIRSIVPHIIILNKSRSTIYNGTVMDYEEKDIEFLEKHLDSMYDYLSKQTYLKTPAPPKKLGRIDLMNHIPFYTKHKIVQQIYLYPIKLIYQALGIKTSFYTMSFIHTVCLDIIEQGRTIIGLSSDS